MSFTLLSATTLPFENAETGPNGKVTMKSASVFVNTLQGPEQPSGSRTPKFLNKLEGLLLAQAAFAGNKRQKLCNSMYFTLKVQMFTKNPANGVYCVIVDSLSTDGLLKRLASICGGYQNITANLKLELETKMERMSLTFYELPMMVADRLGNVDHEYVGRGLNYFGKNFELTESLAGAWGTQTKFNGTMAFCLKLNDEALNKIHLGSLADGDLVNRRLFNNAKTSGDAVIEVENGKKVRCHKAFLTAHSEVFTAMFSSGRKVSGSGCVHVTVPDITEGGARAMLAFLYCCDIKEALGSSRIAMELLRVSDKYEVTRLFKAMKELILDKEVEWFTVAAGVQLLTLTLAEGGDKMKVPDVKASKFQELKDKAKAVLQSKSADEWKWSWPDFWKFFKNVEDSDSEAVSSSLTPIELLQVADKYGIPKLSEAMKGLILEQRNDSFSVGAAMKLLLLVRDREGFKELEGKAGAVLKSKPLKELQQCPEFFKQFSDPDKGFKMCVFFMKNP